MAGAPRPPPGAVLRAVVREDRADADRLDEALEVAVGVSLEPVGGGIEVEDELLVGELVLEDCRAPAVGRGGEVRCARSGVSVWPPVVSTTAAAKGFTARHTSRTARRISVSVANSSIASRGGRTPCLSYERSMSYSASASATSRALLAG